MSESTRLVLIALALLLLAMWIAIMQQQALQLKRDVGLARDRVIEIEGRLDAVSPALPAAIGAAE